MFKFLHAADIHLDSPLQGLERYESAPVDEIRGATRRACERMVALAIEERVDFVLIAGDLYDGEWKDVGTGLYFVRQMARLKDAGIPVYLVYGNHDAANRMTKELPLPDNVTPFGVPGPETVSLEDVGVAIHGQSFARASITEDLAAHFPDPVPGLFNIGLLHTSATGSPDHDPYAPCTVETLRQRGYDYWALGHVHTRQSLSDTPPVEFPGNLQGRHIREPGAKGCLIVTVGDNGAVTREFRALDVVRWLRCEVDATTLASIDDLVPAFHRQLQTLYDEHRDRILAVRVIVTGATGAHSGLRASRLDILDDMRAAAIGVAGDEIWLESLHIQTEPLAAAHRHEGPFLEVLDYAAELAGDPDSLAGLVPEFAELLKLLPAGLRQGDTAPGLFDPDSMLRALDEARAVLEEKLVNEDQSA